MKKSAISLLSVMMFALVSLPLAAGRTANTPATVTFRCPATSECLSADRFQGDFQGPYCCNAANYFLGNTLQMYVLAPRTIFLDFTQIDGAAPCLSTSVGCRKNFTTITTTSPVPGIEVNPTDANDVVLTNGFNSIPVGGSAYARVKINFPDPSGRGYLWTVRFNPGVYAGSTNVSVKRIDANNWDVEAFTTDRARLVSTTTSGKAVTTDEGLYVMPFKMHVTK